MRSLGIRAVAAVVAAAALTACRGGESGPPEPRPRRYATASELIDDLNARGVPCGDVTLSSSRFYQGTGSCTLDNGKKIHVHVLKSEREVAAYREGVRHVNAVHVVGDLWYVTSADNDNDVALRIRDTLGGHLEDVNVDLPSSGVPTPS